MPGQGSILPLVLERVCYDARDRRLIHDLSLEFHAGARTVILGPNGAGKSLALRLCHGLLEPSAGRIAWQGPGAAAAKRRQVMVFQRPVMLRRSVAANVEYGLAIQGIDRPARRQRIEEMLARTGLRELRNRPARVLSAGEQQRLALARAWALEPEIMFLDEPTANLDPAASRAVESTIRAIHDGGTKVIMTTHDLAQARRLADEIVFLHQGRLVERAPAADFFDRPQTEAAKIFIRGELLW